MQHGAERGHDRDRHGDARAIDQPREHAAAEPVGAERKRRLAALGPGRRQEGREQVLLVRIVRREQRREQRDERDQRDDREAERARGRSAAMRGSALTRSSASD